MLWVVVTPLLEGYCLVLVQKVCFLAICLSLHRMKPYFVLGMPRKPGFQHRKKKEKERRLERLAASTEAICQPQDSNRGFSTSLEHLAESIKLPNKEWSNQSPAERGKLCFCKISQASCTSSNPLCVTHTVTVESDFSWSVFVHDRRVDPAWCGILKSFPSIVDANHLME